MALRKPRHAVTAVGGMAIVMAIPPAWHLPQGPKRWKKRFPFVGTELGVLRTSVYTYSTSKRLMAEF